MVDKALFSSNTIEWGTPDNLFSRLNSVFRFTLDCCASELNHKVDRYYSIKDDGLTRSWRGETVWMNPPYGLSEEKCKSNCNKKKCLKRNYHNAGYIPGIDEWVKKAFTEWKERGVTTACLLPSRTDTRWWHAYCMQGQIFFIKGRLSFSGSRNVAPFPSAIVVFSDTEHDLDLSNIAKMRTGKRDMKKLTEFMIPIPSS